MVVYRDLGAHWRLGKGGGSIGLRIEKTDIWIGSPR